MPDIQSLLNYLDQHFLSREAFASAANISLEQLDTLIAAKAIPGVIYKIWNHGPVWSTIGGQKGTPGKAEPDSTWYAPAAIWPARQAKILMEQEGLTAEQSAKTLKSRFAANFYDALLASDAHIFEYGALYENGALVASKLAAQTDIEWQSWIDGGYAVCLRRWDGFHLVSKNVEIERIRALTSDGTNLALDGKGMATLINSVDRLEVVMVPFAPYQRPVGTPGIWIDEILAKYGLGHVPLIVRSDPSEQQNGSPYLRLCS